MAQSGRPARTYGVLTQETQLSLFIQESIANSNFAIAD
jgi:hypothetical protein